MRLYCTTRCIIFYVLVPIFIVNSQNIFDMFNDVEDQVPEKTKSASTKTKETVSNVKDTGTCPSTHTTEYRTVLTAYRHVVKDWIDKFPSKDAKEYRFFLDLSPSEFDRLKKFALGSRYEEKDALHEVHSISELLKRIVYKIEEDKSAYSSVTWSVWLRSFDINAIIKVILIMTMVGIISFISIRTHLRRGRWFTMFFIVAFIVSVIQNWLTLYQEAQAKVDEVLMKKLPKHCQGQSMGFFDTIKSKLGRFVHIPVNECFEYHKALRVSPHSQVTPVQAISMTFAQLFVTPLGAIGEGLSQFFAGTMLHVPFFLWPAIIILILIIVVIGLLMYSRYEIHLPFMMGSIRPSPHAAITTTTNIVEQIENPPNQSANYLQDLENKVQKLQLELQQKTLQIEHHTTRSSRSISLERTDHQRERSVSNQRPNINTLAENELRQRTTSSDIGFKKDFLPDPE